MYSEKTHKPEDIVPESVALRRGMVYSKDRRGKVSRAEIEAPLLIDQLYNHEIIADDHHFYGVQLITWNSSAASSARTRSAGRSPSRIRRRPADG